MKTNFIDTTAGSTHAVNIAVELYMPPTEAARVLAYLDRCQAAEAKVDRSVDLSTPDMNARMLHARSCRSADKEALVLKALENVTLRAAIAAVSPCHRATKVRDHLARYADRYNITKPPTRDTIIAILTKHNYML